MNLYGLLLTIHIVAAVAGIGPAFLLPVMSQALSSPVFQPTAVFYLFTRILMFLRVGAILIWISGIGMIVLYGSSLSFLSWLGASLVLYTLVFLLIIGRVAPTEHQVGQLIEKVDIANPILEWVELTDRLKVSSWAVCSLISLILVLMITRPF